jgi:predicted acetyltransferase
MDGSSRRRNNVNIAILQLKSEDIPTLRRLMQLYLYDLGSLDGWDIADDGTYGNADRIETFWADTDRQQYLVRVDGKLSGFVLTRNRTYFSGEDAHEISEFFILQKYRRLGVGRTIATRVFNSFTGKWEVAVIKANMPAQYFWRAVIADYTGGDYEEFSSRHGDTDFVVFRLNGGGA